MNKIVDSIRNNVLIKIASINSVAILIRIFSGFLTSKFIAIYVGPEGMGLVGNLRNFLATIQSFSTLGLYNGIVKYFAEFKDQKLKLSQTVTTVFIVSFVASLLLSIYCYFNSEYLNALVFNSQTSYAYIIKILAIALPFYALNMILLAALNGFSRHRRIIVINIFSQVLSAIFTIVLIWQHQLDGALIAAVVSPSLILLITLFSLSDLKIIFGLFKVKNFNFAALKNLGSFSLMALFSSITLPMVMLAIRSHIMDTLGYEEAGFWEAILRLSDYYLMFITTLMTLYLLPRFSEIRNRNEFRNEIIHFYKTIIPIFGVGLIAIYFLRKFIIQLVFTSEFVEVEDLFFWQLMGDFVKVLSIVISYQFLAKKMLVHYLLVEAFSVVTVYFTSIYFIDTIGLKGVVIAHFVSYLVHYIVLLIIFNKTLFRTGNLRE